MDLVKVTTIVFGVTFLVGGFLVSGVLVSGKTYFEGMSTEMANAYSIPDTAAVVKDYFLNFGKIYDNAELDEDRDLPIYVHLRDAKFYHHAGKPIPGNRGIWWRARLSRVAGFNMGTLGPVEEH